MAEAEKKEKRIAYRMTAAEYARLQALGDELRTPNLGTVARRASQAVCQHYRGLQAAVEEYEHTLATASSGAKLLKRARQLLAAVRGKD